MILEKCNFIRFKAYGDELDGRIIELSFNLIKSISRDCPGLSVCLKDGTELLTQNDSIQFITERVSEALISNILYRELNAYPKYDIRDEFKKVTNEFKGELASEITFRRMAHVVASFLYKNGLLLKGGIIVLSNPRDNSVQLALTNEEDLLALESRGIGLPLYYKFRGYENC